MIAGFFGSALYSGLETGTYSLNRVRLQLLAHQGDGPARRLTRLLNNRTALLTTLLIGNNLTNYMGTAGLAVILEHRGFGQWSTILLNTLIVTPLLFVFGETLPKDLFSAHSDRLMYRLAPVLNFSQRLFTWTGFVPIIGRFTALLMQTLGGKGRDAALHPRRQMEALVKEGIGYGLLSQEQSVIVERVLGLARYSVGDQVVPWSNVSTICLSDDPALLWNLARRTGRSRFPVLDKHNQVVGVVDTTEALVHSSDSCIPIPQLMSEPYRLDVNCPLREGLNRLQRRPDTLAIVTRKEGNQPVGIVTIKDLVEPITGELANW